MHSSAVSGRIALSVDCGLVTGDGMIEVTEVGSVSLVPVTQ